MNPLLPAAEAALSELQRMHGWICPGPRHCPTAAVIRDLTEAIAAARVEELGRVGADVLRAHVIAQNAIDRALQKALDQPRLTETTKGE